MSRKTLVSNRRAFRKNPSSFIDRITKQPLSIEINDGVNPPYTITVSPVLGEVTNADNLPDSTEIRVTRETDSVLEEF